MNKLIVLFLTVFAFCSVNAQNSKPNTLTKEEKKEGWQLLFNGKDLKGWEKYTGEKVTGWKVIDGVLNNSGSGSAADQGGDIVTKKKFENFELTLEWKIAPQSNSGIFYHVDQKAGKTMPESAPEYQLLDDKGWPDKLHDDQYTGANYAMNVPQNAVVKPVNEWNQTTIIVDGAHVQHFLNGVKVVDYQLWDADWLARKAKGKWKDYPAYGLAKTGNIGLQDHGGLTQFRNMKIRVIRK